MISGEIVSQEFSKLPCLLAKEEVLVGLNEMIRMGWRCSTELYAKEMLWAVK